MPNDNAKISAEVLDFYDVSSRWMQDTYYKEWAEVYRNIHCRVEEKTYKSGPKKGQAITNRTNVALPDHFVMRRKKVARLTAQPPNLRVHGPDQTTKDKVSALMYRQWDLGKWQQVLRQMVDQCAVLGWSVSKTSWNDVVVYRKVRRQTSKLYRSQLMMVEGASPEEILQAEVEAPLLSEAEIAQALAKHGPEVSLRIPISKYEGPIGERVFVGDIFCEPGFTSIHQSPRVVEYSERDFAWLDYWAERTGCDPDTGEEGPVFDPAVIALIKGDVGDGTKVPRRVIDLRRDLRDSLKITDPTIKLDGRLRGPKFPIYEQHSMMPDGRIRIDWVYNKEKLLGKMLYPWDTYGKYIYNELVLIPDLLGGVGQSTIGASRFIYQLRNTNRNLTTDFLARLMRPKMKRNETCEIKEEGYERDGFSEIVVSDMAGLEPLSDPRFPSEAFLDSQVLTREMMQAEPLVNDFSPGTDANPQSGKLATTAIFQQKSADAIVNDELKQLDCWIYDVVNLNLAMTQQSMQKKVDIERGTYQRVDALSYMGEQGVKSIQVDPLEIQQDLELIPETGSTLAADDELKTSKIMQGYLLAKGDPVNFNSKPFAKALAATIPGISIAEAMTPDGPPPQPPPEVRTSVSINYKDLADDAKAWLLSQVGAPVAGTQAQAALALPIKMNETAQATAELEQPHVSESLAEQQKIAVDNKKVEAQKKKLDKKVSSS